jgi:hypothetical protein
MASNASVVVTSPTISSPVGHERLLLALALKHVDQPAHGRGGSYRQRSRAVFEPDRAVWFEVALVLVA